MIERNHFKIRNSGIVTKSETHIVSQIIREAY